MAMAGVGFGGDSLAEAYVMRSLHKEKMKKLQKGQPEMGDNREEKGIQSGCFFWISRKNHHSAKVSSSADSAPKHSEQTWGNQSK
ncbi:hypothetical protein SLE2022_326930 [Rubroshorea leprosula]